MLCRNLDSKKTTLLLKMEFVSKNSPCGMMTISVDRFELEHALYLKILSPGRVLKLKPFQSHWSQTFPNPGQTYAFPLQKERLVGQPGGPFQGSALILRRLQSVAHQPWFSLSPDLM